MLSIQSMCIPIPLSPGHFFRDLQFYRIHNPELMPVSLEALQCGYAMFLNMKEQAVYVVLAGSSN